MSDQKNDTTGKIQTAETLSNSITPKKLSAFNGSKLFLKFFTWFCIITITIIVLSSAYGYYYHYKPAKEEFINLTVEMLQENGQMMVEAYENNGWRGLNRFRGPGNVWLFDENMTDLFRGSPFIVSSTPAKTTDEPPKEQVLTTKSETAGITNNHIIASNSHHYSHKHFPDFIIKQPKMLLNPFREGAKAFFKDNAIQIQDFVKSLFNKNGTNILTVKGESVVGCHFVSEKGNKYVAVIYVPKRIPGQEAHYTIFNKTKDILPLFITVCTILCYCLARYISKPIIELQTASRKFADGDFSQKITEQSKRRNDELGDLAKDFSNMAERIESGIKSQKRLFNDISHELRSPLARMQVSIELLQMKANDNEKPLIGRLEKDLNRMNALISELLQFSKLENKEIGRATEDIDLADCLKAICADAEFEGKTVHKGVTLMIKEDCSIKGVSALIERAFENVIRNGLRYTAENTTVEVTLQKVKQEAIITIADRGPGVPEAEIEKIFAPFYCVNLDRNPQKGSIGLGLSIAQRAIRLHNGTISMANRPDGGLEATIKLPLA